MMRFVALLVLTFGQGFIFGQGININNTGTFSNPVSLVADYLVGGGINVYNVTFSGNNAQQIGYYSNGTGAIGSTSGIAISTGNVLDIAAPNLGTSTGSAVGSTGSTDADILQLAGGKPTRDWYILEFDFVPSGNELYMQYVFGSEEYSEYVCASEADIFAVLISGPGIAGPFSGGGKQASLVPSSTDPAGINSINNGTPGPFGTPGGCISTAHTAYYNDNTDTLMEFDGFTDVMAIKEAVDCEEVYHMRIIIFDCGSKQFDSGIFLPAKSLSTNGSGTYDSPIYNDSVIVEGCKPYEFMIYNVAGFTSQTINLHISGSAQNGVDYAAIPSPITLPAGGNFYPITINPFADGIAEGTETVTVSFDLIGLCGDTTHCEFTIYIQDENPVVVSAFPANQSICAGTAVHLTATVTGGIAPYYIAWNGIAGNDIWVTPTATTTYNIEVYDKAGCAYFNSFKVTVYPIPVVDAGPDFSICEGQQRTLGALIDGGPGASYSWTPGSQLSSSSVAYPTLTASYTQTYTISVSNPGGCSANDAINVTVLPLPSVNAGPDQFIVYQQTSEELIGTGTGTPVWTPAYYLSCDQCFVPEAAPDHTTIYTLTITDGNGCVATDQVSVFVETPTDVFVPTAFSPNGDGNNDVLFLRCYTMASCNFKVYDMWGQPIFETTNAAQGWDGTVNGTPAGIGLYTWTADIIFVNGVGSVRMGGEVNLVK